MLKKILPRYFYYKDQNRELKLTDPSEQLSPQAVQNFYANTYPELVTAKIDGPVIKEDELQFTFKTTLGTKG